MKKILILLAMMSATMLPSFAAQPSTHELSLVKPAKDIRSVTFKTSVHCKNCVQKITNNVGLAKGVVDLQVSLDSKTVTIRYDANKTDEASLAAALRHLGYTVEKLK